jgi:hypothetical protein
MTQLLWKVPPGVATTVPWDPIMKSLHCIGAAPPPCVSAGAALASRSAPVAATTVRPVRVFTGLSLESELRGKCTHRSDRADVPYLVLTRSLDGAVMLPPTTDASGQQPRPRPRPHRATALGGGLCPIPPGSSPSWDPGADDRCVVDYSPLDVAYSPRSAPMSCRRCQVEYLHGPNSVPCSLIAGGGGSYCVS